MPMVWTSFLIRLFSFVQYASSFKEDSAKPAQQPTPIPSKPKRKRPKSNPVNQLFYAYATRSSGMIEPQGIESLSSDLGLDYTDVRVLMLAWKMQAKKQGYFELSEWRKALTELKVDTIDNLKASLVGLEEEVNTPRKFEAFYSYTFRYCLTEEMQRTVDIDSICMLLELVLPNHLAQVEFLVQYLKAQKDYKVINLDQWKGFYRFIVEISFPDFSNFNPAEAWPLAKHSGRFRRLGESQAGLTSYKFIYPS